MKRARLLLVFVALIALVGCDTVTTTADENITTEVTTDVNYYGYGDDEVYDEYIMRLNDVEENILPNDNIFLHKYVTSNIVSSSRSNSNILFRKATSVRYNISLEYINFYSYGDTYYGQESFDILRGATNLLKFTDDENNAHSGEIISDNFDKEEILDGRGSIRYYFDFIDYFEQIDKIDENTYDITINSGYYLDEDAVEMLTAISFDLNEIEQLHLIVTFTEDSIEMVNANTDTEYPTTVGAFQINIVSTFRIEEQDSLSSFEQDTRYVIADSIESAPIFKLGRTYDGYAKGRELYFAYYLEPGMYSFSRDGRSTRVVAVAFDEDLNPFFIPSSNNFSSDQYIVIDEAKMVYIKTYGDPDDYPKEYALQSIRNVEDIVKVENIGLDSGVIEASIENEDDYSLYTFERAVTGGYLTINVIDYIVTGTGTNNLYIASMNHSGVINIFREDTLRVYIEANDEVRLMITGDIGVDVEFDYSFEAGPMEVE